MNRFKVADRIRRHRTIYAYDDSDKPLITR